MIVYDESLLVATIGSVVGAVGGVKISRGPVSKWLGDREIDDVAAAGRLRGRVKIWVVGLPVRGRGGEARKTAAPRRTGVIRKSSNFGTVLRRGKRGSNDILVMAGRRWRRKEENVRGKIQVCVVVVVNVVVVVVRRRLVVCPAEIRRCRREDIVRHYDGRRTVAACDSAASPWRRSGFVRGRQGEIMGKDAGK